MPDVLTAIPEPEEKTSLSDEQVERLYEEIGTAGFKSEKDFYDAVESGAYTPSWAKDKAEPEPERNEVAQENEPEPTVAQETQDNLSADTVQIQTVDTVATEPAAQTPNDDALKQAESRYKTLQGMFEKERRDKEEIRQRLLAIEPFERNLQDPTFQQHVLGYYQQPTMPVVPQAQPAPQGGGDDYVTRAEARQEAARVWQEMQQRQQALAAQQQRATFMRNFTAASQANRDRLVATGKPIEEVESAMNQFQQQFTSGNVYELAHKAMTYDEAVAAAEKRGREKALQEVKGGGKGVPRSVTATGAEPSKGKNSGRSFDDMSPAELKELMDKTDPDSPEFEKLGRFLTKAERSTR